MIQHNSCKTFQRCMCQKPETLRSPLLHHTQRASRRQGPAKGLNYPVGGQASAARQCSVKVPLHTRVPSSGQPPHPRQEDPSTFFILHGIGCAAIALGGGRRAERGILDNTETLGCCMEQQAKSAKTSRGSWPPSPRGHEARLASRRSLTLQFYKCNKLS